MSLRDILLTIHIIGAAIWFGAAVWSTLAYPKHARKGTLAAVSEVEEKIGFVFPISIVLLLISGIWLVIEVGYEWESAFVVVGIIAIILSGGLNGRVFGPAKKEAAAAGGPVDPPAAMRWSPLVYTVIFVVTIWAMVVRLGV